MRFSFFGLLLMQPFEEEDEDKRSQGVFERHWHIVALAILSSLFCIGGVVTSLFSDQATAINLILISLAILTINSGFEWQQGLKARALNHIFAVTIVVLAMLIFRI